MWRYRVSGPSPSYFTHFDLCRNIASQTIARLKDVARRMSSFLEAEHASKERSASLDLLLRFQRLLVSKLYLGVNSTENVNGYSKSCALCLSLSRDVKEALRFEHTLNQLVCLLLFRSGAFGGWFTVKKVHRPCVYSHWRHPSSCYKHCLYWLPPLC